MRVRLAFLLILFLLTSCATGAPTNKAAEASSSPEPTATTVPTAGPTPTLPAPLVILVIPADFNESDSQAYQAAVYDLAQSVGYRFQVRNKLSVEDLEPTLKVVVALPPDPGIVSLAASAPQAQFIAINIPEIQPGGNVSVLGDGSVRTDQVAFMAGYIAAMITEDYHTGVLLRKDTPEAGVIQTAFRAGQEYFCGLCNAYAGPFNDYPLAQDIPQDAKSNENSAYADILIRKKVDTLFLQPGVDSPELLQYLPTVGVWMIGTQTPDKTPSGWVVTLQPNYLEAMKSAFPDLVAGQGGKTFPAPLSFTDANPDLFSAGKQENARKVLSDLLSGYISTGVNP